MICRSLSVMRIWRRGPVSLGIAAAIVALGVALASAYWTTSGSSGGSATTGTLNPPTVAKPSATGGTVQVSWTAPSSGTAPSGYYVTRTNNSTLTTVAACSTSASSPTSNTNCADTSVPSGTYFYNVVAVYYSWTAQGTSPSVTVSAATKLAFTTAPVSGVASTSANLGPITVQLQDASSRPATSASNVTVTLSSNTAGTASFTSSTLTIAAGSSNASFNYGDTKAGTPTITASAPSLTVATQQETITAGAAKTLTASAGTPQSTTVGTAYATALGVTVVDAYGNPVSGATVTFTAPSTGASGKFADAAGSTTTAVTGTNGVATAATFTANTTAGSYNVNATSSVSGTSTATFALTNSAGSAKTLNTNANTTPQTTSIGTTFATALGVTITDANSNPVSGVTVTFTAPSPGASGTFASGSATTTATTNSSGVATASAFTANTVAGSYTVTATVTATGANTASFALTNNPGAATSLTFQQQPSNADAGAVISPAVMAVLKDASGNVVTTSSASIMVGFGANPGSGTLSGTKTVSAVNGVATFGDLSIDKIGTGYMLSASSGSLSATSTAFKISASTPKKIVFTSATVSGAASSTATLGPITVQLQDAYGNVATTSNATSVALSSNSAGTAVFALNSGGTATTIVSIPSGSSTASFYYGDTKRGTSTITASSTGLTSGTQQETINAASASQLLWVTQPPTTTPKTTPFTIALKVVDQFGNALPGAGITLALNNPGGVNGANLSATSATSDASTGIATISESVNKTGTFSINASANGVTTVASNSFMSQ